jgi:asparagine synthase (glutamine-hydrolysing)
MRNQLLRDTDWASMAHGLEVRVPLVDTILLRRMAALVGGASASYARILKTHLAYSASRPLPARIANRPKTGFATPIAQWLQDRGVSAPRQSMATHTRQWARHVVENAIAPSRRALSA